MNRSKAAIISNGGGVGKILRTLHLLTAGEGNFFPEQVLNKKDTEQPKQEKTEIMENDNETLGEYYHKLLSPHLPALKELGIDMKGYKESEFLDGLIIELELQKKEMERGIKEVDKMLSVFRFHQKINERYG